MTEPTIDEMLLLLDDFDRQISAKAKRLPAMYNPTATSLLKTSQAIRAILEQHRDPKMFFASEEGVMRIGLECIRAFVERVEKRLPDYDTGRGADAMLKGYRLAVYDELAEMEEGAKQ